MSLANFRKDIVIELLNEAGQVVKTYLVYRCWPTEYQALPHLDATGSATARPRPADTVATLAALSDVTELHWGDRRFRGSLAELTVTETAFGESLQPVAATVRLAFEVRRDEGASVSVTVSGEPWRRVSDAAVPAPTIPSLR